MTITDEDIAAAVLLSLGKYSDGYDVGGIVADVASLHGGRLLSENGVSDLVSSEAYWDIVAWHDKATKDGQVQAARLARAANLRSLAELREDRDRILRLQAELQEALDRRKKRVSVLLAAKVVPVADVIEATGLKKQRLYQLYDRDGVAPARG